MVYIALAPPPQIKIVLRSLSFSAIKCFPNLLSFGVGEAVRRFQGRYCVSKKSCPLVKMEYTLRINKTLAHTVGPKNSFCYKKVCLGSFDCCMSKKVWPISYCNLPYKFGQDFMGTYYIAMAG